MKRNMEKRRERFVAIREGTPRLGAGRVLGRIAACLGTLLASLVILLLGVITVVCKGPSPTVRDLFVTTVMETSAAKFLARMYFSEEEIRAIQAKNAVVDGGEVTDSQLAFTSKDESVPLDTIELADVAKATFRGKMLIVHDPSRVHVAVCPSFGKEEYGLRVEEFAQAEGAVAAINGGGFEDENGVGRGGMPLGLVIKDGRILNGSLDYSSSIVGFDRENRLIVGTMTGREALEKNIRDAVSFGPVFVVNGKPADVSGSGGGLNPRTVLGQRADGAVLMLVIDGRQPHSIGASYKDCIDVMMEFGAVNAANLDGGSSTLMYYQGEVVNVCASLYGSRKLPTAFIVT